MTVVLALCCSDGVVMAADSQATEGGGVDVKYPVQKVFPLTSHAVWGGSGSGAVIASIGKKFEDCKNQLQSTSDMPKSLAATVRPALKNAYEGFVQVPGMLAQPPVTSILAAGWSDGDGPWIVEVDPHATGSSYTDIGKHSIGSGAGFALVANAMMSHFDLETHPIDWGTRVAYRALNAVIQTSAAGVGEPIQIWTASTTGLHQLSPEELADIKEFVDGWQQLEAEALAQAMAEIEAVGAPVPAPLPPDITEG